MSYLAFSNIGQSDDPPPAVSPHSLFAERKITNRGSGGGTVIEDRAPAQAREGGSATTVPPPPLPPVYFPPVISADRVFGVEYPVAFLLVVSNVITLLLCMLLIIIAG